MREDKTVIVTGASRGIGAAAAKKLARRFERVALIYAGNDEAAKGVCDEITALGAVCRTYKCDVSDFDACAKTVKLINDEFGAADILVNNAGITRDKLILAMKEEDFDAVISVNLKGCFNMIKACIPAMIKKRYGKIINITSVAGIMGNPGQANYAASKAGVIGLTKTAAKELASRNICVNAVAPGFIDTDMTENFKNNEAVIGSIPQKRVGKPEEVAALVDFLAGAESDYITGEVIRIDGGLAM